MATAYVLVQIEYREGLDPNDIIPRIEGGTNIQRIEVLDIDIPNGRENTPYIAF